MRLKFAVLLMLFMTLPAWRKVSGLPDFTELVEKTAPAVVNIQVTQFGTRTPRSSDQNDGMRGGPGENHPEIPEFFRRYFNVPNDPQFSEPDRQGTGSGFIYDPEGYILTNHHVVADADEIIVRMADRREFEAELIGSDESSDIAVLKIKAKGDLPFLKLGIPRRSSRANGLQPSVHHSILNKALPRVSSAPRAEPTGRNNTYLLSRPMSRSTVAIPVGHC